MTGEVTLRGKVLPIGGLKEKTLAAHRAGIKTFILPKDNAKDIVELPQKVRDDLQLIPVSVIAYRSQYGSVNPTAVVGPGIVATAVSTGAAILFCRIMDRKS